MPRSYTGLVVRYYFVSMLLLAGMALPAIAQFEENRGQSSAPTQFLIRHRGVLIRADDRGLEFQPSTGEALRLSISGSKGRWIGERPTGSTVTYRIGSEVQYWGENIRQFSRLRWADVVPGVDWVVYINEGNLEYDFELSDSSLLASLSLRWSGKAIFRKNEELVAALGAFDFRQRAPRFFSGGKELRGHVARRGANSLHFELDEPAPAGPLRVDPIVEISGRFGGPGDDQIVYANQAMAIGLTRSAAWDRAAQGSGWDVFVRVHMSGDRYTTIFWGGTGDELLHAAVRGSDGDSNTVHAVGSSSSRDLPSTALFGGSAPMPTITTSLPYGGGSRDALFVAISPTGLSALLYGGADDEVFQAIQRTDNNAYYAGEVRSADSALPQGLLAYPAPGVGIQLARLPVPVSHLAWSQAQNLLYLAGTVDREGMTGLNAPWSRRGGARDVWLAAMKFTANEPTFVWQGLWGGPADETPAGLQWIAGQGLLVVGNTNSNNIAHVQPAQAAYGGGEWDGFLLQLNESGSNLERSTYIGGNGADQIRGATQYLQSVLVAGSTDSTNWTFPGPQIQTGLNPAGQGSTDAFLGLLSYRGSLDWAVRMGGGGQDEARHLNASSEGIWVGGHTSDVSWLSSLNPAVNLLDHPGTLVDPAAYGIDTFAIRIRANLVSVGPMVVGQNLRLEVAVNSMQETTFDGLVEIVSPDPSKLLVTSDQQYGAGILSEPAERTVITNLLPQEAGRIRRFYVDAVGEPGAAEILLRYAGMPERRFPVRIAPSAIFTNGQTFTQRVNSIESYSVFLAPIPATGQAAKAQPVRAGLDPRVMFGSSDPQALTPVEDSRRAPNDTLIQFFELRRAGTYQVYPSSPVFPTAPNQTITITDSTPISAPKALPAILTAQGLSSYYTIPSNRPEGPIVVTSDHPDLLLVSVDNFGAGAASVTIPANGAYVFLQSLAGSGSTRLTFRGAGGWTFTQEVRFVATKIRFASFPTSGARGEVATLSVAVIADNASQLDAEPSGARPIAASLASFPMLPLLRNLVTIVTSEPAGVTFMNGRYTSSGLSFDYTFNRVGDIGFRLEMPNYLIRETAGPLIFPVRPQSFLWPETELVVAQGTVRALNVLADLPRASLARVRFAVKDPNIAQVVQGFGPAQGTVSFDSYAGIQIAALGKPGDRTVVTFSTDDARIEVPVRIAPFRLAPQFEETRISGAGLVSFGVTGLDNNTLLPADWFGLAATTTFLAKSSDASVCTVSDRIEQSPRNQTFEVKCAQPGVVEVELTPGGALTGAPSARFRVRSGWNPLETIVPVPSAPYNSSARVVLGSALQASYLLGFGINLTGPLQVESLDPDLVRISRTADAPGQAKLSTANFGNQTNIWVQAANRTGSTFLRFTGIDGRSRDIPVFVWPSSLVFTNFTEAPKQRPRLAINFTSELTRPVSLPFLALPIDPITNLPYRIDTQYLLNPSYPLTLVRATSSNPQIVQITPPTPVLNTAPFSSSDSLKISASLLAQGSSILELDQPEGFVASPYSRLLMETSTPQLRLSPTPLLARGLQSYFGVATTDTVYQPNLMIRIRSTNPEAVVLATTAEGPATAELTWRSGTNLYIRCLREAPAAIELSAPGYATQTVDVAYAPVQLSSAGFQALTTAPGQTIDWMYSIDYQSLGARLNRNSLLLNPDSLYRFELKSSDGSVLDFPNGNQLRSIANSSSLRGTFVARSIGEATLSVQPTGEPIAVPPPVTVRSVAWTIQVSPSIQMGRGQSTIVAIRNNRPTADTIRVEPLGGISAGRDLSSLSSAPFELQIEPNQEGRVAIAMPLYGTSGKLLWSAEYATPTETAVHANSTYFRFATERFSSLVFNRSQGPLLMNINVLADNVYNLPQNLNPLLGPVTVGVSSSNPQVAHFTEPNIIFSPGAGQATAVLRLNGPGTTILSVAAPAGFSSTNSKQEILITVQ